MAKLNQTKKAVPAYTHEGGRATRAPNAYLELRRTLCACLLWEDTFYESGVTIEQRVKDLVPKVPMSMAAQLAVELRTSLKLRHAPLLLVRELARHPALAENHGLVAFTLSQVIQRPDELAEFMAIYWKDGKQPLSAQVKKGLAAAFANFNEFQLARYNRDAKVKLKDVAFLAHPHAWDNTERDALKNRVYKDGGVAQLVRHGDSTLAKLVEDRLAVPDTWETQLSAGADKKTTFERLMVEKKLGALAFIRNLRNMVQAGVASSTIRGYAKGVRVDKILPFQFVTAARLMPAFEDMLEELMLKCLEGLPKLYGKSVFMIDVSGSMKDQLAARGEATRVDAAAGLAILARELCEEVEIYTFSNELAAVPPRRGFALRDAILRSQPMSGTHLRKSWKTLRSHTSKADRSVIITDEQSHDGGPAEPLGEGFIINVANYKHGVGYGQWTKIDGWSEHTLTFIRELEAAR